MQNYVTDLEKKNLVNHNLKIVGVNLSFSVSRMKGQFRMFENKKIQMTFNFERSKCTKFRLVGCVVSIKGNFCWDKGPKFYFYNRPPPPPTLKKCKNYPIYKHFEDGNDLSNKMELISLLLLNNFSIKVLKCNSIFLFFSFCNKRRNRGKQRKIGFQQE